MSHDLSPAAVARRLACLRAAYVPETEVEVRRRLAPEPRSEVPFAEAVASRLAELRALCELTAYLQQARRSRQT
jgi:hypothetical protein